MFSRKVAARLLIPAATLVAEKVDLKCKPSELPIYTAEIPKDDMKLVREPGAVEKQIGNARRQVMSLTNEVVSLREKVENLYNDGKNQADWLINYLREEDNTTPKAGAIAVGGLAGFILALRGGFFRKVIFTSAGALGMAAVCYPKEAAEYSDIAGTETKKYIKIVYNFVYGVKKGDPPLELPTLPKIPTSLSEVWSLASGTSTKNDTVTDKDPLSEVKKVQSQDT